MSSFLDSKGRVIVQIDANGKVLFGRYKDMSDEEKGLLLGICESISSDVKKEDLIKFLNFEQEDFCS